MISGREVNKLWYSHIVPIVLPKFCRNIKNQGYVLFIFNILLVLIICLIEPRFISFSNINNIVAQAPFLALISLGQFYVVVSGGLDLSVGGLIAFISILSSLVMAQTGIFPGVSIGLLAGIFVGCINAFFILVPKISSVIVTLAMMIILQGLTLNLSGGIDVYGLPQRFIDFGISRVAGIPASFISVIIAFITSLILLNLTNFGLRLYCSGGNERAVWLLGINVFRTKFLAYVICSLLIAVSSILLTARIGMGQPHLGSGLFLENFAAVFVSGARFGGGEGSLGRLVLGVLFILILRNGLNLLNVSSFIQMIIMGSIIVIALIFSTHREERS
jgi:ribose transport system permease protein